MLLVGAVRGAILETGRYGTCLNTLCALCTVLSSPIAMWGVCGLCAGGEGGGWEVV